MLNTSNVCNFFGTLVKDPDFETVNAGGNSFSKVKFTLAVKKVLTKTQREARKNGQQIIDADFVPLEATGGIADTINNYFKKGSRMIVTASFRSWNQEDKNNPGKKIYGYGFNVEGLSFIPDGNGGNNNGGNNNSNNHNQNNNKQNTVNNAPDDDLNIDESDIPF